MKELCKYSLQQKKLRAAEHRRKHAHDGLCGGLTQSEYNRMTVRQKSTFQKLESSPTTKCGKKHTRNSTYNS
jgi:hypothetical protein